jgi:hypothetical protein
MANDDETTDARRLAELEDEGRRLAELPPPRTSSEARARTRRKLTLGVEAEGIRARRRRQGVDGDE